MPLLKDAKTVRYADINKDLSVLITILSKNLAPENATVEIFDTKVIVKRPQIIIESEKAIDMYMIRLCDDVDDPQIFKAVKSKIPKEITKITPAIAHILNDPMRPYSKSVDTKKLSLNYIIVPRDFDKKIETGAIHYKTVANVLSIPYLKRQKAFHKPKKTISAIKPSALKAKGAVATDVANFKARNR